MKSSNELQKFILSIRPELKDFISLTKSNNINIKNYSFFRNVSKIFRIKH